MDGFSPATTPEETAAAAGAAQRPRLSLVHHLWAEDAARGLARRRPDYSAQLNPVPLTVILLAALVPVGILAAGLGGPVSLALLGLLALPCLAAQTLLRLAAAACPLRWAPRRPLGDSALPRASLVIALYREAAILPRLLQALDRIDYPRDRLEILLALECDDTETRTALARQVLPRHIRTVLVPPGEPRTKPRALNHALRHCTGEILAIFDAEDRPHPDQLRAAAESFAAGALGLACVQAPLNWFNGTETWITRQFTLEYAAHFHALLPLYRRLRWPIPLGGTSNYFRTRHLRTAGAWDAWNVTEDADLGLRLQACGFHCDVIEPMTLEEAPLHLSAWMPQRTRWLKGYLQTLAVHWKQVRCPRDRVALALTLGGTLLSALSCAPGLVVGLVALVGLSQSEPAAALLLGCLGLGYTASAVCALVATRRAGRPSHPFALFTQPLYDALKFWPAVRALYQLVRTPYLWEKTEHGVSAHCGDGPSISRSPPPLPGLAPSSPFSSSPAGEPDSRPARSAAPA